MIYFLYGRGTRGENKEELKVVEQGNKMIFCFDFTPELFQTINEYNSGNGLENILIVYFIAKFLKLLVALREEWHNGSKAKHEAKKVKIETHYLEHKLKCRKRLTNKPTGRKAKTNTYTKTIR